MYTRLLSLAEKPRIVAALIFFVAAISLGSAYASEIFLELKPCILCIYQRWPYVMLLSVSLLIMGLWRNKKLVFGLTWICAIIFYMGATIAGFHVGVEQGWWEFKSSCTIPDDLVNIDSIEQMRKTILGTATGKCDEPEFFLFGITMAGYNFIWSLICGTATLFAALRQRRKLQQNA